MAVTADQIIIKAGYVLQDVSATRWSFAELCGWLNEAVSAIVLAQPSATSQTITMDLQAGTLQELPAGYISLLRLTRNISSAGPPRVGGRVIRITTRDALDAILPDWHNPVCVKYSPVVKQFIYDADDPLSFYVYPGNDGTGIVEGIVSELPTPVVADGDPTQIGSYTTVVGLKDIYQTPILDYVLYRAFSKDDTAGNPETSQAHFQAFTMALGVKDKVASVANPNAVPNAAPSAPLAPGA